MQVNEDLRAAERAFNDVHKKYERTKEAIGEFKRNEDTLKVKCMRIRTIAFTYVQSGASPHSWYFVMFLFASCEGLLGQWVARVSAHQPGNFPKHIQQNITN